MTIPHDKALHFIAGVLIFAVAHFGGIWVGVAAVTVAAVGKEIYDWFHRDKHTPDIWDAVATVLGGVVGFTCCI